MEHKKIEVWTSNEFKEESKYLDDIVDVVVKGGFEHMEFGDKKCLICSMTEDIENSDYAKACLFSPIFRKPCIREFTENYIKENGENDEEEKFVGEMVNFCKYKIKKHLFFYYATLACKYKNDWQKYKSLRENED